jgi:UDP-N-acetylmuramoyl-tripeptide--D-alanyl-D-alanine ligase
VTPLTLDEVVRAIHGRVLAPLKVGRVTGVSTDSRTIRPGDVFFAVKGPNFDGHDFAAAALDRGAVAAVVEFGAERREGLGADAGGLIRVRDTTAALGTLAAYYRKQLAATVIAVTGSNGKTTVKLMIDHVLAGSHHGRSAPRSFNNQIGVPLTLLSAEASDDYLVVEIGTNAPGEVAALGQLVEPNVAVVTNVSEAHLEGLGTLEGVVAEKLSLLKHLRPGGRAILNADCKELRAALPSERRYALTTFGHAPEADVRVTSLALDDDAVRFEVNDRFEYRLQVPGRHNVSNALAAIAVARRVGLEHAEIAPRLATFSLPPMRLESHRLGPLEVLFDGYNANPASMAAALEVLRGRTCRGRKVAVLGDMAELGRSAERLHRRLGEQVAGGGATVLAAVGRWAGAVAEAAAETIERHTFDTTEAALEALPGLLRPGDLVLIKGSRTMRLERVVDALRARFGGAPTDGRHEAKPGERLCSTTS